MKEAFVREFARLRKENSDFKTIFPQLNAPDDQLSNDIFVKAAIAAPIEWALRQMEESFCDLVGLYLFNTSYLHAFAYLLSPAGQGTRHFNYPNTLARIDVMIEAAGLFSRQTGISYTVPKEYLGMFANKLELFSKDPKSRFLLSVADATARSQTPILAQKCNEVLSAAKEHLLDHVASTILERFKFVVPSPGSKSITNILHAAWTVYHNNEFWPDIVQPDKRLSILKELTLKNLEVLEIEQILSP